MLPLRRLFAATAAALPRSLVTEVGAAQLATIVAATPELGSECGFECRLGSRPGRVDLGIGVRRDDAEALARRPSMQRQLDTACANDGRWQHVARFLTAWCDPGSVLRAAVPFIFLEIDAGSPGAVPSVFVALDWPLESPGVSGASTRASLHTVARDAIARLGDHSLLADCASDLEAVFGCLGTNARVFHIGVLLGRLLASTRISISAPWGDLPAYLQGLGISAAPVVLEKLWAIMHPAIDPSALQQCDFDLPASATGSLHVALRLGTDSDASLLEHLVARGLCNREQRSALLAWPGQSTVPLPFLGLHCQLQRYLSHVKLHCGSDGCCGAKVYFGVTQRLLVAT